MKGECYLYCLLDRGTLRNHIGTFGDMMTRLNMSSGPTPILLSAILLKDAEQARAIQQRLVRESLSYADSQIGNALDYLNVLLFRNQPSPVANRAEGGI